MRRTTAAALLLLLTPLLAHSSPVPSIIHKPQGHHSTSTTTTTRRHTPTPPPVHDKDDDHLLDLADVPPPNHLHPVLAVQVHEADPHKKFGATNLVISYRNSTKDTISTLLKFELTEITPVADADYKGGYYLTHTDGHPNSGGRGGTGHPSPVAGNHGTHNKRGHPHEPLAPAGSSGDRPPTKDEDEGVDLIDEDALTPDELAEVGDQPPTEFTDDPLTGGNTKHKYLCKLEFLTPILPNIDTVPIVEVFLLEKGFDAKKTSWYNKPKRARTIGLVDYEKQTVIYVGDEEDPGFAGFPCEPKDTIYLEVAPFTPAEEYQSEEEVDRVDVEWDLRNFKGLAVFVEEQTLPSGKD